MFHRIPLQSMFAIVEVVVDLVSKRASNVIVLHNAVEDVFNSGTDNIDDNNISMRQPRVHSAEERMN